MSGSSRPGIRDVIKNGQFTTRDLNTIPEEKRIRPNSSSTIDSEPDSPTGRMFGARPTRHVPRDGDVMLMPLDLGIEGLEPDLYLTAVPSIVTYTVGRGYSSVRMEEINLPHNGLPAIEEVPSPSGILAEPAHDKDGFPILPPPPGFRPVSASSETLSSIVSDNGDDIDNTDHRADDLPSAPASMLTSPTTTLNSPTATPNLPPVPPKSSSPRLLEKHGSQTSSVAWPLSDAMKQRTTRPSLAPTATTFSSYSDHTAGTTPRNTHGDTGGQELQQLKSRFSWCDADAERRTWVQRWVHDWWLVELVCLFLTALFIAVICILVVRYNGTEIPEAWAFGVTLNALISVLGAFARVVLFFPTAEVLGQLKWHFATKGKRREDLEITEEKNKGPLESIKLLARTKRITWGASIGAMLLLALPMDFCFQQLVHYPTVWLPGAGVSNGTVSRSVMYNPALNSFTINGTLQIVPDPYVEAISVPFFIGNGQEVPMDFDCPTSNCTFAPFWTMALESSCKEMPSLLRPGCEMGPAEWAPAASTMPNANGTFANGTSCGWYVDAKPPGSTGTVPILMSGYATLPSNGSVHEALVGRLLPLRDVWTKQPALGDFASYNFANISSPAADFLVSSTPGGIAGAYKNNTPTLHECAVWWVAQKLNVSVFEGRISASVIDSRPLESGADPSKPLYGSGKFLGNYSMELPDDLGEGQNETVLLSIDNFGARRISLDFEEIAPSAWFGANTSSTDLQVKWVWRAPTAKISAALQGMDGWLSGQGASSGGGSSGVGVGPHLASLTTAMSHAIWRTQNGETQQPDRASGQAWRQAVIVRAAWMWIVMPAALLLFSTAFIAATIVHNSGNGNGGLGVWRTAALTVKVKKRRKTKRGY